MGIRTVARAWPALEWPERASYLLGAALNETRVGKQLSTRYLHAVGRRWLYFMIQGMHHVDGAEHIPLDRSFILAPNHRTFFDLYATMAFLWQRHLPREPYLYCPVRSAFFYDQPYGAAFNILVSGNAMYPPIFRDDRGRGGLNDLAIERCVRLLDWSDRTLIAIHPEGKRNPVDDPYSFLPAKVGTGRIALRSRAPVIPVFVNGLHRDFGVQLQRRLGLAERETIRLFFGPPVELSDLYGRARDPDAHLAASQRVMDAIGACAEREKAWLAAQPR